MGWLLVVLGAICLGWAYKRWRAARLQIHKISAMLLVVGGLLVAVGLSALEPRTSTNAAPAPESSTEAPTDAAPSPYQAADPTNVPVSRFIELLSTGNRLYDQAAIIVSEAPTTRYQAALMVDGDQGPAGKLYSELRDFQSAINCPRHALDPHVSVCGDLAESETFLYTAVVDVVASCNAAAGRAQLRVARAYLDESQRDLHGTSSPDWTPPDDAENVSEADHCQ